jgi:predicted GIY-YIG superfamily endonuclease
MPFIYALRNRTTDLVYYGSTTRPLQTRLRDHRNQQNTTITSKQITSCPTAYIELCEEVSEEEMLVRERWWIENNPCVNKHLPFITREERAEQLRDYHIANRDHRIAKQKEHYLANLDDRRAQHREYHHANKEQINARKRANYLAKKARSPRHLHDFEPPSVSQ